MKLYPITPNYIDVSSVLTDIIQSYVYLKETERQLEDLLRYNKHYLKNIKSLLNTEDLSQIKTLVIRYEHLLLNIFKFVETKFIIDLNNKSFIFELYKSEKEDPKNYAYHIRLTDSYSKDTNKQ